MLKQIKVLLSSLIVGAAAVTLISGAAIAESGDCCKEGSKCCESGCCKAMQQKLPMPGAVLQ